MPSSAEQIIRAVKSRQIRGAQTSDSREVRVRVALPERKQAGEHHHQFDQQPNMMTSIGHRGAIAKFELHDVYMMFGEGKFDEKEHQKVYALGAERQISNSQIVDCLIPSTIVCCSNAAF